jgi:hypothetical protein
MKIISNNFGVFKVSKKILRQGGKIMKKASFFIVLGLAVLLLFGCAGGGGPLGGVSTKPVDTWFVEVA